MQWIDRNKYIGEQTISKVLGMPERKAGYFDSTEVVTEAKLPEMEYMPSGMEVPKIPSKAPLTSAAMKSDVRTVNAHIGVANRKSPEKIPVKEAGK